MIKQPEVPVSSREPTVRTPRTWSQNWSPDKQKYRETKGPVFAANLTLFDPPVPPEAAWDQASLRYQVATTTPNLPAAPVAGMAVPTYVLRGPIPGLAAGPELFNVPVPDDFQPRQPEEVLEVLRDFFPVMAAGPLSPHAGEGDGVMLGARFVVVFDAGHHFLFTGRLRHFIVLREPTGLNNESLLLQYVPYWVPDQALLSLENLSGSSLAPVIPVRRRPSWRKELSGAADYFKTLAAGGFAEFLHLFGRMGKRTLSEPEVGAVLRLAYPQRHPSPTIRSRVANGLPLSARDQRAYEKIAVQNRYQTTHYPELAREHFTRIGAVHPDLAGSALALYLAVCFLEDNRTGHERHARNLTDQALFSVDTQSRHRVKTRAFSVLAGLARGESVLGGY
jgi:hypothetical protein